jgi:hypothetical protein
VDFVTLAVIALATARLTRLVTTDRITETPRNALVRRLGAESKLAYLVHCDWCSSIYIAPAVTALVWWQPSGVWIAGALAASHVTGYLASRMED